MKNTISSGMALRVWVLAILALSSSSVLSLDAENQDNLERMEDWLKVHNRALAAGFVTSGVVGSAVEITELSANIVLKTIPAVLEVPENRFVYPNLGSNGEYSCTYAYSSPQVSAGYNELLGLGVIKELPGSWGDFGSPRVEHRNSSVKLTLGGIGLPEEGETAVVGSFPEGDHTLSWLAETQYSPFWDGSFPAFMAGFGVASEAKFGKIFFEPLSRQGAKKASSKVDDLIDLAKDVGVEAGLIGAEIASDEANLIGDEQPFARHLRTQLFRVWDVHPPEFRDAQTDAAIETQTIAIEASDFGGARFSRIRDDLIAKFKAHDDCGRSVSLRVIDPPSLIPIGESGVEIEWVIQDDGRYNSERPLFELAANQAFLEGEPGDPAPDRFLRTTLRQRIVVRDEQPPLLFRPDSFVRETTQDIVLNGDPARIEAELGRAQAVDLADPVPEIFTTAPNRLEAPLAGEAGRRYLVRYDAVDDAGNSTVAQASNPDQYTQIVTLKPPGANTAPSAVVPEQPAVTVSNEPVRIALGGSDGDDIGGLFDPLVFNIVEPPAHGEFVAPLFPTFIEDFRSKPTRTPGPDDPPIADCPSSPEEYADGGFLEAQLGLMDVNRHDDYVIDCYCAEDIDPPTDFIYRPDYIHIDNQGLYYVSDNPLVCNNQPSDPGVRNRARLGTWRDGAPVHQRLQNFASGSNSRTFDVDAEGFVWQLIVGSGQGGSASADIERYQPDLAITGREDNLTVTTGSNPLGSFSADQAVSSYADIERGVLYVSDKRTIAVFALDGPDNREAIADLQTQTAFNGLSNDAPCNTLPGVDNSAKLGFTMQTDSAGYLYVADSCAHQIHKFAPTALDRNGDVAVGAYQGWLGKCTGNLEDPETGVAFNNCIVEDATSNGFACTDETCAVDPFDRRGTGPGQFDVITHLNLDPNDTLYVADFNNRRIQRFGADGAFAGEAQSTGAGVSADSSFVLGNMGPPKHVSVNSSSFHVLESRPAVGDFFLHIFTTLPFTDVTADSATVEYISDISYTGTDTFSFLVDDGLAQSAPATVTISVGENQRPPNTLTAQCFADGNLQDETTCELLEDTELFVRLSASDPDGFAGFGGRETLSFRIVDDPAQGELAAVPGSQQPNSEVYRYVPGANRNGSDRFTFQASDGVDEAEATASVTLSIVPQEDDVVLTFPQDLRVARGFEESISIEFSDPDQDASSVLRAQVFDWGDGVVAREDQGWTNIGVVDDDGNPVDPQRDTLPGQGLLVGAHVFNTSTNGYRITLQDGTSQVIATSGPVIAAEVTRVNVLKLDGPDLQPGVDTPLDIQVINEEPQGWAGLPANAVQFDIDLPDGLDLVEFPAAQCTPDAAPVPTRLTCDLGNLSVGASSELNLMVRVDLASARAKTVYGFRTTQRDAGPRLSAATESVLILEVADSDGDGTIDADDAFPDDARYFEDTDDDRIADSWEVDNGFDPNDSADASIDLDGDGFDTRREFELEGAPRLVDAYLAGEQLSSGLASADDRFGFALASADLNGDALADVVIGAPNVDSGGAAFVYFGGSPVQSDQLTRIDPAMGVRDFGRSVAMGDLDGNGTPDLAVGGDASVSVYLSTQDGLPTTPSRLMVGLPGDGTGQAIVIEDVDGDAAADLVFSAPNHSDSTTERGTISVFLASSGWWLDAMSTPDKVLLGPDVSGFRLGTSLAVADIDGDNAPDLLAGNAHSDGQVYGYLGSGQDWGSAASAAPNLVLGGESPGDRFGWSIAADGDIDGDGVQDLVVGAYRQGAPGTAYVYGSRDAYWSALEPTFSDRISSGNARDQFGVSVAMLLPSGGKVGADVIVGANRFEQGDTPDQGTFYLYDGGTLPLLAPRQQLSDRDHDMLGYSLKGAGDINGDGSNDFIVGAPDISVGAHTGDGGFVQLFYGGAAEPQTDADGDGVADALDNCPAQINRNQLDADGDSVGDVCDEDTDIDSDNDGVNDSEDAFPDNPAYQRDSDGDGLPDAYETANGLNPNLASDASADLDGDGRSNLEEFQQGSDIGADDVAPVLTLPADVLTDASGPLTPVEIGAAIASDARDGALTPIADTPGPFPSGRHQVTWTATDAAGNQTSAVQIVDVRPQVHFVGKRGQAPEGAVAEVVLALSGDAVEYPVLVTVTSSGTATENVDFQAFTQTIAIDESNESVVVIQTLSDAIEEGTETVILAIADATNSTSGQNDTFVQQIVEGNVLAAVRIQPEQGGERRTTIFSDQGLVTLQAQVSDPNAGDSHLFDWTGTDLQLVAMEGPGADTFTFDPSLLAPGIYRTQVTVVDSGEPLQPVRTEQWLAVAGMAPILSAGVDSDGDGVSDADEGLSDFDLDGVSAYLDANERSDRLVMRADNTARLQTEPGLRVVLGSTARAAGSQASITLNDVAAYGSAGAPAQGAADDGFAYLTDLVDFAIEGLNLPGDSAQIVVPLGETIPPAASYRKYLTDLGWRSFEVAGDDQLASAPGTATSCPFPGHSEYRSGLNPGDRCVQLSISDGGPNDTDGLHNARIADPSGVAVQHVPATLEVIAVAVANETVSSGDVDVTMLRFRLNSDRGSARLGSVRLQASGSGDDSNEIRNIKLWADRDDNGQVSSGDALIGTGSYAVDDGSVNLAPSQSYDIPAGESAYLVTYDF